MQSVGMIETCGLLAAIQAADTMLKGANVTLLAATKVGGGLVTVVVEGEVAAVEAALQMGVGAARQLAVVHSAHMIPRPAIPIGQLLQSCEHWQPGDKQQKAPADWSAKAAPGDEETEVTAAKDSGAGTDLTAGCQVQLIPANLENMTVAELRTLLLALAGDALDPRAIKNANRKTLIKAIRDRAK